MLHYKNVNQVHGRRRLIYLCFRRETLGDAVARCLNRSPRGRQHKVRVNALVAVNQHYAQLRGHQRAARAEGDVITHGDVVNVRGDTRIGANSVLLHPTNKIRFS
jgi:hypothetical protein